jgi:hypothetical protein
MQLDQDRKALNILRLALDLPVAERATFAQRACGIDAELLKEVQKLLLTADDLQPDFLEPPEDAKKFTDIYAVPRVKHHLAKQPPPRGEE